jgi:hypothetical protein
LFHYRTFSKNCPLQDIRVWFACIIFVRNGYRIQESGYLPLEKLKIIGNVKVTENPGFQ